MNATYDKMCKDLVTSVTTFYTHFDENLTSDNMLKMRKASSEIRDYMDNYMNLANNLVKDINYQIDILYINWSPNKHSDTMLKLLRVSDKLLLYMEGNFDTLWDMEKHDNVDMGKKYPGLGL